MRRELFPEEDDLDQGHSKNFGADFAKLAQEFHEAGQEEEAIKYMKKYFAAVKYPTPEVETNPHSQAIMISVTQNKHRISIFFKL